MTGKALKDSIKIVHSFPDMRLILSSRLLGARDAACMPTKLYMFSDFSLLFLSVLRWYKDGILRMACERQLRQKYKSFGALKIVTARGLHVTLRITSHVLVLLLENLTYCIIKPCWWEILQSLIYLLQPR
ncbi:hypothetical protein IGI04_040611 [Brassica rapa subsp. trilocularis]|uniref:Uncharacterized protein n=1 Tax=Brassica rapa subsp. trilocularis TaxID=1813537 RepID=A0ABQ7KRA0_BRACM|nr:hypothetical protein IGI04_040611 [Brassica rapa subsp. trilocularis]